MTGGTAGEGGVDAGVGSESGAGGGAEANDKEGCESGVYGCTGGSGGEAAGAGPAYRMEKRVDLSRPASFSGHSVLLEPRQCRWTACQGEQGL